VGDKPKSMGYFGMMLPSTVEVPLGEAIQAVPFDTLQTAAAEGPVILINISKYLSDAIILHINNPLLLVALPNL